MSRAVGWFLLSLAVVAILSGLAGHAPARVRLLLLFPIAFGLMVGGGVGLFAHHLELRRPVFAALIAALLSVAGLANVARIAYGELAAQARRAVEQEPQRLLALRILEGTDLNDPRDRRSYYELRTALKPTFGDYLASRLTVTFGWHPEPWPDLVWGCEVLISGIAAAWAAWRLMGASPNQLRHAEHDDEHEPAGTVET